MSPAAPAAAAPATLAPGTVLGDRFEILGLLGEGGMGTVYRAKDRAAERLAAVKVLKKALVQSKEFVGRFKREARAAARFRHEAAVRVLSTGETDDKLPWIAMELVEGASLKELLEREGRLSPGRACNLAMQLLRALAAAHAAGIVHRDMKPDNIRVVTDADGIERPKILDFGVAKFVRGDLGDVEGSFKTKTGVILGTPKYMAPEQIRGEAVDGRSDIYALGAMLHEMLTGKPPFEAADVFGFVAMHLKQDVPPIGERFPELDVPQDVDVVVLRMLAKDPRERPADPAGLATELEKYAIEDPKAGQKSVALRRGMAAVVVAGVAGAAAPFFLAPAVALAAGPVALALGIGSAIAAARFSRPSVYSYVKRFGTVAASCLAAAAVASFLPGSPGPVVAVAYALAALLSYAGFLLVWAGRAKPLRFVLAGIAAPLVAAVALPVLVRPADPEMRPWFVGVLTGGSDQAEKAAAEEQAKRAALLALATTGVLFGAASVFLPRPGAARVQ